MLGGWNPVSPRVSFRRPRRKKVPYLDLTLNENHRYRTNGCENSKNIPVVLLMEEIPNNHLGCIKSCKIMGYSIYHINWCRIATINSIKNSPHPWDWYIYCNCKFTIEINQMLSKIYPTLDGILYSKHVQFLFQHHLDGSLPVVWE